MDWLVPERAKPHTFFTGRHPRHRADSDFHGCLEILVYRLFRLPGPAGRTGLVYSPRAPRTRGASLAAATFRSGLEGADSPNYKRGVVGLRLLAHESDSLIAWLAAGAASRVERLPLPKPDVRP